MFLPLLLHSAPPANLSNEFVFHVTADAQKGEPLKIWIPLASDRPYQVVTDIKVDALGAAQKFTTETEYGNKILFLSYNEAPERLDVKVSYRVKRINFEGAIIPSDRLMIDRFLAPDRLVPLTDRYQDIAKEVVRGKTVQGMMQSIYNHVVETMEYDYNKESPRLGMGDVAFVCDYKRGNCSDLHSYIISLARISKIPAYLEYGFPVSGVPIPDEIPEAGSIGGYHCWTWYYDKSAGWYPLDASDGRRWTDSGNTEIGNSLFKRILPARSAVAVSRGRDITLTPRQSGGPLNYFIKPHAQQNYQPIEADWTVTYKRLP